MFTAIWCAPHIECEWWADQNPQFVYNITCVMLLIL